MARLIAGWWDPGGAALLDARSGASHAGLSRVQVRSFAAGAEGLLTLAAHYRAEPWPLLEDVRPRLLLEQDPGYGEPLVLVHEFFDAERLLGGALGLAGIPRSPV